MFHGTNTKNDGVGKWGTKPFPFLYKKFIFGNCVLRNLKKLECSVLPGKIAYKKNDPTGKLYLDYKNYKYLTGSHIFKLP